MKINNLTKTFKPVILAIAIAISGTAINAYAEDVADTSDTMTSVETSTMSETYSNDWMKPLAAEFAKLDTSGNGLLLPLEASKGKAFNKKTFAQADTDHDGSIDLNEYMNFKSGHNSEMVQP